MTLAKRSSHLYRYCTVNSVTPARQLLLTAEFASCSWRTISIITPESSSHLAGCRNPEAIGQLTINRGYTQNPSMSAIA
jgi:hypothetical protein